MPYTMLEINNKINLNNLFSKHILPSLSLSLSLNTYLVQTVDLIVLNKP